MIIGNLSLTSSHFHLKLFYLHLLSFLLLDHAYNQLRLMLENNVVDKCGLEPVLDSNAVQPLSALEIATQKIEHIVIGALLPV